MPTVPTVTPARRSDVGELAALMAEAFLEDPPMRALVGERDDLRERAEALYRAMLLAAPLRDGTIDVARTDDGPVGAAIWYAPGRGGPSVLHQLPQLRSYLRAFGAHRIRYAARVTSDVAAYHPHVRHWYLQAIGVLPAARGAGVGSALLAHRLAAIDAAGDAAYLESSTPRTGALYRRHGFGTLRPITVWPGAQPYAMWRPAREPSPTFAP